MASLQRRQGALSKNQPMGDIDGLSSQAFEGSVAGRINGAKKCGT
jgi:hypothetical protein